MIKKILILILTLKILTALESDLSYHKLPIHPETIAHAAGAINNKIYSNSYEALNLNYKKGFKYFEIDLSHTKDNKLVCVHNWKKNFKNINLLFPLSFKQFNNINNNQYLKRCTLEGLVNWLKEKTEVFIITDVKDNYITALETINTIAQDTMNKFIPQIYNPKNFKRVKKLGLIYIYRLYFSRVVK